MSDFLFWLSLFFLVYIYSLYPALVFLLSLILGKRPRKSPVYPTVSLLIPAYNEADCIEATLANKLQLIYPQDKLEILVISDGSDDGTDEIVKRFAHQGVKLLRQDIRAGKTVALNRAVHEAGGEIIVFSDGNSLYQKDAIEKLVRNFNDPAVGYATGKMVYEIKERSGNTAQGCSAYMKYENFLRAAETGIGSIVGVDGGIDAVRKSLYKPMNPDQLPDFVLPLSVVEQGYRVVYEQEAVLKEDALSDSTDEYHMRVRVALRALWAIWDMRHLLNPKRYGLYSWQLWSHKVLRYFAFLFILIAFITNVLILNHGTIYVLLFLAQLLFFGCAITCKRSFKAPHAEGWLHKAMLLPYYFCLINLASAHSAFSFMMAKKIVLWKPRKG